MAVPSEFIEHDSPEFAQLIRVGLRRLPPSRHTPRAGQSGQWVNADDLRVFRDLISERPTRPIE